MLAGLGQIELLTRLRGSWCPKRVSSRIHQKLGAGVCEDLQELGDPPEPEDSTRTRTEGGGCVRSGPEANFIQRMGHT